MMTIFLEALLWGAGISIGLCIGGIAWILAKEAVYRLLGVQEILDESRQIGRDSLESLLDRNRLTKAANNYLERIAFAIEAVDDDDDESELWKHGDDSDLDKQD